MGLWSTIKSALSSKKKKEEQISLPAQKAPGVIVTDFTTGESVTTKIDSGTGSIVSQTYSPSPEPHPVRYGDYNVTAIGEQNAYALTNREGGLVEQNTINLSSPSSNVINNSGTLQSQLQNNNTSNNNAFYVSSEGRKNTVQLGALFVTPQEALKLKGTGVAYWELESKTPEDLNLEMQFVLNTPYVTKTVNTRGVYEYNLQNILAGKEAYKQYKNLISNFESNPEAYEGLEGVQVLRSTKGTQYSLTPEYFEKNINFSSIYSSALSNAKLSFKDLSKGTRTKLNVASYAQGLAQGATGIAEFGGTVLVNMGVQTFKEGEFSTKSRRFYFSESTALGDIATYPTVQTKGLKQKITSPDFLGQATLILPMVASAGVSAYKNIRSSGWKAGTAETLALISPFRIKSGIYGEGITTKTKFNTEGFKFTNAEGVTKRLYAGTSTGGGVKIAGFESSKIINGQTVGKGIVITEAPFTEIRAGGAIINQGIRTSINPYQFEGAGSGTSALVRGNNLYTQFLSPNYKGGTSNVFTQRGITIYETPGLTRVYTTSSKGYRITSGASYIEEGAITKYLSGRAKPIYETSYGDTTINLNDLTYSRDFLRQPSGRYKVNPQIRGVEYDLNKLLSNFGDKGYSSFRGSGRSGSTLISETTTGIRAVIPKMLSKPVFKSPSKIVPPIVQGKQQSAYYGLGLYERTDTEMFNVQRSINVVKSIDLMGVAEKIRKGEGSRNRIIAIPKVEFSLGLNNFNKQNVNIISRQVIRVRQIQKISLASASFNYGFNAPQFTNFYNPIETSYFPVIDLPTGFYDRLGIGNARATKSQTSYTPSFTALFFKIRGKKRTNRTGLDLRPISSDFSFQKRVKRLIKVKL